MSLLQRAKAAHESLHSLEFAITRHDEARQIQELRSELTSAVQHLLDVAARAEALLTQDVPVSTPDPAGALRQVRNLREKLVGKTSPEEVRRGHLWANTVKAIQTYAGNCEQAQKNAWKSFLEELFQVECPEVIKARLAMTPENRGAFADYTAAFQKKQSLARSTPSAENAQEAKKIVTSMHEAYRAMDFKIPPEVKSFLDDAVSLQGASIIKLTPTVADWLQENDMLDQYTVRHRR